MRLALPTRRSAAVLAASSIGLSTALLGVTGVASAAPAPDLVWDTDSADTAATTVLHAGDPIDIPAGYCSVDWVLSGAAGGNPSDNSTNPGFGTEVGATVPISGAQHYTFTLGTAGGNASSTAGGTGGSGGGSGLDGAPGTDDGTGTSTFGGGGGGATTVLSGGGVFLEAPGGTGADTAANAGGGAGGGTITAPSGVTPTHSQPGSDPNVRATAHPCFPAPQVAALYGGDGTIDFQITRDVVNSNDDVSGTQYSLDGGTTWADVNASTGDDEHYSGTLTGLALGHTYSVVFRFQTNTAGAGLPSAARSVTTYFPAPTDLRATVGTGSITFTWNPPADTTGITGYIAWAISNGAQSGGEMIPCATLAASARSCTVTVPGGAAYWVAVAPFGAGSDPQNPGNAAAVETGIVPTGATTGTTTGTTTGSTGGSAGTSPAAVTAPATVPTGSGQLGSGTGAVAATLTAGQKVPVSGSGYAPNSVVSLYVYSTPTLLGTVTTDAHGAFSTTVTIPATLAPGTHHLVSAGTDPSGNPRYLRSDVTVTTPSGQLAWTGFETTPVALVGGAVLLLGLVLLVVTRRRRTA